MTIHEPKLTDKQVIGGKIQVKHSYFTIPQYLKSITSINYPNKIHTDTLLKMKENLFLTTEQPNVTIIAALQKLDNVLCHNC